jgi:hypothetical protein
MMVIACVVLLVIVIMIIYLMTRNQYAFQKSRESYGACYKDLANCPENITKGQLVLNPFVWPYSGSSNFDATLSKSRLDIENFDNRGTTPPGDVPAYASRIGDFTGVAQNQLDTANDHRLRSLQQEPDHDILTC